MSYEFSDKQPINQNNIVEELILKIETKNDSNWSKIYSSKVPNYILDPNSRILPKFYLYQTDSFINESRDFYQSNINLPLSNLFLGMYQEYFIEKGKINKEAINFYLKGNYDPFCMIKLAEGYIRINELANLRRILSLLLTSFIITSIESHKFLNPFVQIKVKSGGDMEILSFDNFFYLSYYYDMFPSVFLEVLAEIVVRDKCSDNFKEGLILIFSSMHDFSKHKLIMQKLVDAVKCDDRKAAYHYCCFSIYLAKLTNNKLKNVDAIFHILKIIADEGNPFAAEKLALLYEHKKDYKSAFNYYIKAEDYLLPNSLNQLAIYYCSIKNPLKNIDTKKAYDYWTKATYSGMAISLEYLKLVIINGDNKRLYNLSYYYYKCKIHSIELFIGYCYEKGKGVEKNTKIAMGLYKNGIIKSKGGTVILYRMAKIMEKDGNLLSTEIYRTISSVYTNSLQNDKKDPGNMWIIDAFRLASLYKSGRGVHKNINTSIELLDSILNAKITEDTQSYICIFFYLLAFQKKLKLNKQNNFSRIEFFDQNRQNNEKSNGNNKSSIFGAVEINYKTNGNVEMIDYNKNSLISNQITSGELKMDTDQEYSFVVDFKVPELKQKNLKKSCSNLEIIKINKEKVNKSESFIIDDKNKNEVNKMDHPKDLKKYTSQTKFSTSRDFQDNVLFHISKIFSSNKLPKRHENDFMIIKNLYENIRKCGAKLIEYNDIVFDNLIGNGGHSKVFSGWIEKSCYAIKEFQNVNETNLRRVFEEINIQISLKHENINKALYIAFDLNPFKVASVNKLMLYNLRYVINNVRPNLKIKLKILEQIFISLNFLHCQSPPVVHRDLKPENILIDENYHVEICDFGVFKILDADKTCSETLNQFYTVRYSPPEVIKNCHFICKASDIWSIGLLLYDIFYEEQPWPGLTNEEIADSIKKERPFPVKNEEKVPGYIISMIKRCTNYDYSVRPKVSDLLAEINNIF